MRNLNEAMKVYNAEIVKEGEEKTAVRFTLNAQGKVENINTLQTSLVGDRK